MPLALLHEAKPRRALRLRCCAWRPCARRLAAEEPHSVSKRFTPSTHATSGARVATHVPIRLLAFGRPAICPPQPHSQRGNIPGTESLAKSRGKPASLQLYTRCSEDFARCCHPTVAPAYALRLVPWVGHAGWRAFLARGALGRCRRSPALLPEDSSCEWAPGWSMEAAVPPYC
jgi:hypothetical protein